MTGRAMQSAGGVGGQAVIGRANGGANSIRVATGTTGSAGTQVGANTQDATLATSGGIVKMSVAPVASNDSGLVRSSVDQADVQATAAGTGVTAVATDSRTRVDPATIPVTNIVGSGQTSLTQIDLPIGGLYRLSGGTGTDLTAMGRAANGLGGINAWRSNGPGRRYLIETDPRFVNYDNFISSDLLLDKLGVDPEWTQTRLGDGFYEQRLVLDQITQLTGRRYLGNYADGVAQYRALLESGVAAAGQLQLSMGVGLTAAQAAALTQDIVWMVEQDYQGQKVLVPVVYLASNSLQLRGNGALIAGGNVELNATNSMGNQGVIAGADVSITAGNLLNQGRISGTGSVALEARNDLLNQGQIQGRDVALVAGNNLVSEASKAINGVGILSGISASNTLQMFAGNDMTLTGTRVQADSAALIAGNNFALTNSALHSENGAIRGGDAASIFTGTDLLVSAGNDLLLRGITLASGGSTELHAGNDLSLTTSAHNKLNGVHRGGDAVSVTTGKDLLMSAGNDLQLHGVTINAGGSAALQAGNNLSLTPTTGLDGKVATRTNISTGDSLQLTAGNDLTIRQADVKAGGDLIAAAGNNLNVESVLNETETNSYKTRNGKTRVTTTTTTQTIDQQALTAGGNLILSAGNDVNLVAAKLDAGKGLGISAGNDINASTLTTVDTSNTLETRKRFKQTTSTSDETVHGTEFSAGGNLAMQAGNDITLTAASAATKEGGITLAAGNDVNLLAASEQHDAVQDMTKKKKGTFSSKTTTTHDEWRDNVAVTTTLSGDTVQIAAGNDLLSQGAQIVGTGDVTLAAGNNLTLETAQNTHSEEHDKVTTKSGLFGSGGIGVTLGKQKVTTGADIDQITHTGTTVGSLGGDVTLVAGNKLAITGSDVMALQGDLTATGKDIAITEVYNDSDAEQRSKFSQGGLSLTLSSAAISLAQAANDSYKASKEVKGDSRMEALALGSAAYSAYGAGQALGQAGSALSSGSAASAAQGANLSIAISIGGSKSESKSTQTASLAQGSKLQAGGDVNLIATGGGDQSNLLIRGSDIKAGNDLLLAADHDVLIEAAKNTAEQKSTSKSSSASLGVGITYGPDGAAFGVMISAAGSRGKANGEDVTYSNSHLAAGNTATVISGNDTTLKGAQLSADKVIADVGGNLSIESLQDTSTYDSKDKSVGASVTFGAGFSASASYSSNKVSGDFASVTEQSGIQAGDGGFNIRVGGNTDLKGAVIASTQAAVDAGVNRLQTGTLTYSDIENTSSYDAKGFSLSGGYSKGTGDKKQQGETGQVQPTVNNGANWSWQNFQTGSTGTAAGIGSKSGDATSTTTSGISGGSLLITDEAGQLAKSGKTAADALAGLKRDVISGDDAGGLTKQWDGQALRDQVAAQAQITATAGQQATKFVGDYAQGKVDKAAELYAEADATGDDSKRAEADQLMKDWGNGGTLRVLSHAVVGGLTGGTEGALGAAAGTVAAPYLAEALEKAGINKAVAATLTGLSASALGAAAGGAAGGAAALNEVSNNYLGHQERMEYATALIACSKSGTQCERAEQLKALSEERNLALRGACSDPASGGCAEQKQLAAAAMQDQLDHAGEYTAWLAGQVPELVGLFNSDKDGSLTKDFVTHVTTADLGHKLACAMAGDCSNQALASAAWNGSIPLSVATADSALRAALGMGAGTVGATGRVWEMVTGVAELAKGMSPAGQVGKSIDQLAYLWGNGYAATAEKNFNDAKGALNAIKTGISGYAEDLAFAAYTNTHGSWDIYDIAKAGAIGGKVSVDVLSLVVPELYAGKGGVAAKAATGLGDAFKADDVIDYLNSTRPNPNSLIRDEAGSVANSEVVNYFRVEGGGTGTATSKNRITANSDGSISINPGCSGQLCVSVGAADHAVYYLSNKRPDGSVIVFEVDASLHGEIMNSAIPQRPIPGIPRDPKAPKIVDPNKPGTALELPKVWESLLENGSRNARVYTHDEFLKEFGK
ncbi:hemagglutinin repeat-containing protein [Xanthomonas arboricola]|uniref:hemagglutinin repeat-containing protein n=2 Tax=Xanthomonas arboricola TaxID=56448 RepID=UPI004040BA6B